ncbi:leucine-rich repeat-containing protein 27 isoform X2 [Vombatus ursinus]|uniref:leucine-rich repeat-containing protein 27 isoform X2 n=1 Tax=Vombatus ursinus TaxID=29139 RepID=UPI000FFD9427|nr:leucine-rich repeat-containing protein 27 isoform X2 [Vombatus ursinus]
MEGGCSIIESKGLIGHMESSSVKTRTPSIPLPKDVRNVVEGILFSPSPALDLSQRGLEHLSEEIFKIPHLKQLHLQRNELIIIPKDFFQLLPNLVWLDLRHNKIKAIPSGIGSHKNLKTLLMEKNPIKTLPVELGNLASLKALNLRSCPLEFPPRDVIRKGLLSILAFLRNWAQRQGAVAAAPCQEVVPVKKVNPEAKRGASNEETLQNDPEEKGCLFPHVEALNLAEVTEPSVDFSEDCFNEEEMKQFWKLRQEIVSSEKAEMLANQLLPLQLPLSLQSSHVKEHVQKLKDRVRIPLKKMYNSGRKISSFKNMFPEIPSYETTVRAKKDEERRVAALKELKEKQALIEQRKRDKKMLQKWREQADAMKKEKERLVNRQHPPKDTVLKKAPFATDPVEEKKTFSSLEKKRSMQLKLTQEQEELRSVTHREIEERVKLHMEALHERRKKAKGTPQEEILKAAHHFGVAKKLRDDVRQRYLDRELRREYRFTAFTGDATRQLPTSQPHNIFFNTKF